MRHLLRLSFCLLLVIGVTFSVAQPRRAPLTLLRVTPAGDDVPLGTQIVFEFNRPVVPLGRMERQTEGIPIAMTPPLPCTWRWLNPTTLACELGERSPTARATRYTVTVRPGIQAEDGATLAAPVTHTFLTQRPKITDVKHHIWVSPGTPELLVLFDQPVTSSSVTRHVYIHLPGPAKKRVAISANEAPKYKSRGWLIRPAEELPQDASAAVWVEPGIVSTQGREPGGEQRAVYPFDTLPSLRVLGLACVSNAGQAATIPALTKRPHNSVIRSA